MSDTKAKPSKKDELIGIAGDMFYRQGYAATGIKQIIDEASIAKGTFYSHFSSKEEIGIAWLQKRNDQWNQLMKETSAKAKSPRAKILVLFNILEEFLETNDYRGCAFLNSLAELPMPTGEMRDLIREHKQGIRDRIIELARAHYTDSPNTYSDHKGLVIYLLFEGALVEAQNYRDLWPVEIARKETEAILRVKADSDEPMN